MPAPPEKSDKSTRVTILVAVTIVAVAGLAYAGYEYTERRERKVDEREVTVPVQRMLHKLVLQEVKTEDGKTVKAYVPVPVYETTTQTVKQEVVREMTPEQKQRLNIVFGAACLVGFFFLVVVLAYGWALVRDKEPHKSLEDWLNRLGGTLVGVVLTFLGLPAPEAQSQPPAPAAVAPADNPVPPPKAP
jgi:translation initiation factor IF-1